MKIKLHFPFTIEGKESIIEVDGSVNRSKNIVICTIPLIGEKKMVFKCINSAKEFTQNPIIKIE